MVAVINEIETLIKGRKRKDIELIVRCALLLLMCFISCECKTLRIIAPRSQINVNSYLQTKHSGDKEQAKCKRRRFQPPFKSCV